MTSNYIFGYDIESNILAIVQCFELKLKYITKYMTKYTYINGI